METTEKISITIGRNELRRAKKVAAHEGFSLSTFISRAVRESLEERERRDAALELIATFPPEDRATPEEVAAFLESWGMSESPADPTAKKATPKRTRKKAQRR